MKVSSIKVIAFDHPESYESNEISVSGLDLDRDHLIALGYGLLFGGGFVYEDVWEVWAIMEDGSAKILQNSSGVYSGNEE